MRADLDRWHTKAVKGRIDKFGDTNMRECGGHVSSAKAPRCAGLPTILDLDLQHILV